MTDRAGQFETRDGTAAAGRLVAIVVTHDRPDHLCLTLDALLASPASQMAAVLVVDNASGPDTRALLSDRVQAGDPRLHVLTQGRNLGGAGGFEVGMRHAMAELAPDWLLVLDDDARPEADAIAAFHALDLTGWEGIAAAVYNPDGTPCDMNRPTLNPFRSLPLMLRALAGRGREAFHLKPADYDSRQMRRVDGASFVGLFVSARVVQAVGYPDGRLFIYADDAMYTLALTAAGHPLGFAPQIRFMHDSRTFSAVDPRIRPLWKVYYYHRNLTLLYRWAAGWLFWPVMAVYVPRWAWRTVHHRGERRIFLRLFRRGLADGLRGRLTLSHAEVLRLAGSETVAGVPSGEGGLTSPAAVDGTGAATKDPAPMASTNRPERN